MTPQNSQQESAGGIASTPSGRSACSSLTDCSEHILKLIDNLRGETVAAANVSNEESEWTERVG